MVNSGSGRRTRLSTEDRLDQIVAAGIDLIASTSWDALTMLDIAAAVGVSKPLLYHYFSTKNDLYTAAVERAAAELRAATATADDVRTSLAAHVRWIDENAAAYLAVIQGGGSRDPIVRAIVEAARQDVVDRIVAGIRLSRRTSLLRVALHGWVGFLEGSCVAWLTRHEISEDELVDLLVASLPAIVAVAR